MHSPADNENRFGCNITIGVTFPTQYLKHDSNSTKRATPHVIYQQNSKATFPMHIGSSHVVMKEQKKHKYYNDMIKYRNIFEYTIYVALLCFWLLPTSSSSLRIIIKTTDVFVFFVFSCNN